MYLAANRSSHYRPPSMRRRMSNVEYRSTINVLRDSRPTNDASSESSYSLYSCREHRNILSRRSVTVALQAKVSEEKRQEDRGA